MRKYILLMMAFSLLFSISSYAEEEYIEYTIKKGDTLWDISGLNLKDPFLWPKIWKDNPDIKNPDLIYPGQKIRIPLRLIQKQIEVPTEKIVKLPEKKEKPVKIMPKHPFIVKSELVASSGYIDTEIPNIGRVVSSPTGRSVLGRDDYAYVEVYSGKPDKGKRFYTLKSLGEITHPVTGEFIGYLIQLTGVVEVVEDEAGYTKVKVLKSFSEIETGSLLDEYYPIESYPLVKVKAPEVHGTIVAARNLRVVNGVLDVVYIDRGMVDGLRPGNIFTVISADKPNRPIGKIQVIATKQKTAAAMIIESEQEITRGDYF
jgi:LysM repeat protein